jgi:hypothetical protein
MNFNSIYNTIKKRENLENKIFLKEHIEDNCLFF